MGPGPSGPGPSLGLSWDQVHSGPWTQPDPGSAWDRPEIKHLPPPPELLTDFHFKKTKMWHKEGMILIFHILNRDVVTIQLCTYTPLHLDIQKKLIC